MAHVVRLKTVVEYDGATFSFKTHDASFARVVSEAKAFGGGTVDLENITPGLLSALCGMFVDSVFEWDGVVDEDGTPIPCDESTKSAFPMEEKIAIVMGYWARRNELGEGPGRA